MPTKKPRIVVTFVKPEDIALYEMILRDATIQERSDSFVALRAIRERYAMRKTEAEVFTPNQPPEDGDDGAVDFDSPSTPVPGRGGRIRKHLGEGNSA